MPITVITPLPPGPIGPGMSVNVRTSVFGPFPTGTTLGWVLSMDSEGTQSAMFGSVPNVTTNDITIPLFTTPTRPIGFGLHSQVEGGPIHLVTTLTEPGNTTPIDSGSDTFTWGSSNVGIAVQNLQGQGSSGLSPVEQLQLQQTQQATWPQHLVDQMLTPFLGHGTGDLPIAVNLTSPVFGVIVRLTSIPTTLVPTGPDQIYWVKTLASLIVFRGSDLWLRVPIHTPSKLVNLWIEGLSLGLADAVLSAGWLLNLSLQVFFLPGVEGDVFLMRVP